MLTHEQLDDGFSIGDWDVLPNEGIVRRGDESVHPEPQTLRVLLALARRDGKLVSKQDLIDEIWEGRPTSDEPITRAIREVRKCFGDSGTDPAYVKTLHKRGYHLMQPVVLRSNTRQPEQSPVSRRAITVGLLFLGVAVLGLGFWLVGEKAEPVDLSTVGPGSIAILPFQNLSGQDSDAYIVSGLKVSLVQALHGMGGFVVKNSRVDYAMEPDEIARTLNVENILFGSLLRDDDRLVVSYEISRNGEVRHTDTVHGSADDLLLLHERVASSVRAELGGDSTPTLIKGHRPTTEAYDSYMRGMHSLEYRGDGENLESAMTLFSEAIRLDPNYGPAYLGLATAYALVPDYRRRSEEAATPEWNRRALDAANLGVQKDPLIADAVNSIYGFVYHKEKRWSDSERAHLKAVNSPIVDSNAFNWYSRMLSNVGRMEDALDMALRAVEIDPTSAVINSRAAIVYTWLEDNDKAYEYFRRARDLGARGTTHLLAYAFLLSRTGEFERAEQVTFANLSENGENTRWVAPVFAAFDDSSKTDIALAAVNDASLSNQIAPQVDLTLRVLFGDIDGAMQIARKLEQPGEIFEMELLFVPELRPLREHADFMPLLERLGVVAYWLARECTWRDDRVSCAN